MNELRVEDVPRSAWSETRLTIWLLFVVLFIALSYAGRAEEGRPPEDTLYRWDTVVNAGVQGVVMLAFALAIAWRGPAGELLGIRQPASWRTASKIAVAIFVLILVLALSLEPVLEAGEEQGFVPEEWDPSRAAPFAANFVVVAGLFPVVEELLFRGAGFALLARFGRLAAVVATGALFGLAHGLINALPILVAFGIGLGWLRERTGSVLPCIALHAAFNGFALVGVLLQERAA
jgi:membrane protease YdiL (CAAX protease family)